MLQRHEVRAATPRASCASCRPGRVPEVTPQVHALRLLPKLHAPRLWEWRPVTSEAATELGLGFAAGRTSGRRGPRSMAAGPQAQRHHPHGNAKFPSPSPSPAYVTHPLFCVQPNYDNYII
ncbi:unnamed protein product [Urochloa humidicola]